MKEEKCWVEVVENPDGSATLHLEINQEIEIVQAPLNYFYTEFFE